MRMKLFLAVAVAALASAGAALADGGGGNGKADRKARAGAGIVYQFTGKLTATPSGGHLSISVVGGNRPALRALLGRPASQTFSYGDSTRFLKSSNGAPAAVQPGDLDAGDYVGIRVRAPLGSSLAEIEGTAAAGVTDRGTEVTPPTQPLFLFRGELTGVGSSSVTVAVKGGNRRALRLLIGAAGDQTFTVGGSTVFVVWKGTVPSTGGLSDLKVGDPVAVRIRAAAGSTLSQVETTSAARVADREPAGTS
jgi:Domain of unknown function (DUF5666)